jgi:hypothetical protein
MEERCGGAEACLAEAVERRRRVRRPASPKPWSGEGGCSAWIRCCRLGPAGHRRRITPTAPIRNSSGAILAASSSPRDPCPQVSAVGACRDGCRSNHVLSRRQRTSMSGRRVPGVRSRRWPAGPRRQHRRGENGCGGAGARPTSQVRGRVSRGDIRTRSPENRPHAMKTNDAPLGGRAAPDVGVEIPDLEPGASPRCEGLSRRSCVAAKADERGPKERTCTPDCRAQPCTDTRARRGTHGTTRGHPRPPRSRPAHGQNRHHGSGNETG